MRPGDMPLTLHALLQSLGYDTGRRTSPRPTQRIVPVAGTDKVIVPANPHRLGLLVSNTDLYSPVWIGLNTAAVVGQGVLLPPNQLPLQLWHLTNGDATKAELHALATLTGATEGLSAPWSQLGGALSGAAIGVVLSETIPAGSVGQLLSATIGNFTGAPTVALQIVRGATTITLLSTTVAANWTTAVSLIAGDVVQWNVTAAVAASHFDATISGTQTVQAGSAPASINLAVWELESCGMPV